MRRKPDVTLIVGLYHSFPGRLVKRYVRYRFWLHEQLEPTDGLVLSSRAWAAEFLSSTMPAATYFNIFSVDVVHNTRKPPP